ncbi:N12 class adenine-specific DNA methylase [Haloactinopolyspora alba]|uniref:N12 class adenine-specific DNA methylase n=1 Tax=Haloactinopolyspora alba TaxID=648780 RepID=A0A2P8EFB2_9ACTN|nr:helicase-related protein [Haloactinopolyspora alba]PSL08153.1 N12 class adenine-specific DNA methylase [Haloactinopolyspora alba]
MRANVDAIALLDTLDRENRAATASEQAALARWSGWGAVPQLFDEHNTDWRTEREHLHQLLGEDAYTAARRTTINAHYTDPDYARAMWDLLTALGFDGGRVWEPGCGAGTFVGLAPDTAEMVGVELDPTSARVAAALYPDATVAAESFADTRYPAGHFDATIGNVPFANVRLHDPRHNPGGHALHNHAILKSLGLTRPGGLVAVLTSHFTLDAQNPAARREMNALADLLGAVRLPSGAHRRAAGTEVVTDLLVFRRRDDDTPPRSTLFETVAAREVDGEVVRVNSYFDHHPGRILGELGVGHGMHGEQTLHVTADLGQLPGRLTTALADVADAARRDGLTMTPRRDDTREGSRPVALAPDGLWDGHLVANDDGTFSVVTDGVLAEQHVPRTQRAELTALLGLRDAARALLTAEAADREDTPEIETQRADLASRYRAYVARFGPINRFTTRPTGRTDPETGELKMARVAPPVMRIFRTDPFAALVKGLEHFDEATQTATPATMMSQRVVAPRAPVLGADTPGEALQVVLDTAGRVELAEVARLLGTSEPDARTQLGELVYDDPHTKDLRTAEEYLSGNVRAKLATAEQAAETDPDRYAVNVAALRRVVPADLGPGDIEARLGAAWIDAATHERFLAELLDDDTIQVEHPGGAVWEVRGNKHSVAASSEWGTERMPAPAIVKAVLEQRPVQVTDETEDGKRVLNPVETAAAQEKAGLIQERFAEWVWQDPDRAAELQREYNDRFNAIVLRDYTTAGQHLTLPGLAETFEAREHQRTAVARMLAEPAVGLFHEVGAGKTAEMVIGAMELRRLGMVTKPAVVVPNHMLEQFTREWLQLYPTARVLAASSEDLRGEQRRVFVARCATNDWDAVVMTRGAFERIPVSADVEAAYQDREMATLRAMLDNSRAGHGLSVKRLEKKILAAEEQLKERLAGPRDPGISFEQTGIDYLVVDELHDYKNLRTVSNIRDAAIDGSRRASDLHMKTEYLRSRHGERVITGATATPIANSVTEAHVMQRYLRPDLLEDAGVGEFDAWAATFGQTVTEIEMAPAGGYRLQTRFAKFQNVPEMLTVWHVFADVKTADDLNLPTPALAPRDADGERAPVTVVVPAAGELTAYVNQLGERAEKVKSRAVDSSVDNMLMISTDGRKAALDMRLVTTEHPDAEATKLDTVADTVARIWKTHREDTFLIPGTDQVSQTRGALQIVFCDLATPSDEWNAYDELRDQLARRGMPREQVRFMHEAGNDTEKARLFAAARAGQVSVLVGSTAKMGVGTNVQNRAVALHHLDCPWRPADIAQREGRILRQGNQNPEVQIYRYVTEGSFDGYLWQTVERKARFIAQIMRGRLDVRSIDDVGDNALSFAEVKALAAGDPLVLDRANASAEVNRLQRLQRAHHRQLDHLRQRRDTATGLIEQCDRDRPLLEAAIARTTNTTGEAFAMTVDGARFTKRPDAAAAIADWALRVLPENARSPVELGEIGSLAGHTVEATYLPQPGLGQDAHVELRLRDVPASAATVSVDSICDPDTHGVVRVLENRVAAIGAELGKLDQQRASAVGERDTAEAGLDAPFKHETALTEARATLDRIDAEMAEHTTPADDGRPADQNETPDTQPPGGDLVNAAIHDALGLAGMTPPRPAHTGQGQMRPPGHGIGL